ncbi:2TM domain-containing protein [Mycobacterium sp. NPDC050853]|uniref:2TM domain-containing protein n=1 Tax=Mycobacteriaceae TaxID=1762 RepID=UPI0015E04447|nr:2TM domain-containing protein [Mycobacteroides sp. LB1]
MSGDAFERAVERAERRAEDEQRRLDRKRRDWIRQVNRAAFQIHAGTYVAVQILLVAIWALTWRFDHGTAYPWFVYPLLGWGIGLIAHYIVASTIWRQRPEEQPPAEPWPTGVTDRDTHATPTEEPQ